jgi:transcriptional regulator with XRE-family HTH domain
MIEATTKELHTKLGAILKQARESSGLTQRQVATKLGYSSPQYVSNWERGRVSPPLAKLAKVVDIVNASPTKIQDLLIEDATRTIRSTFSKRAAKKSKH